MVAVFMLGGAWSWYKNRPQSHEFAGNVQSVQGDTIVIRGQFVMDGGGAPLGGEREVKVRVAPGVPILREGIRIPSDEELKKTNGMFRPDELPKEASSVGLERLAQDAEEGTVGIHVKTIQQILGRSEFEASEISYRTATY